MDTAAGRGRILVVEDDPVSAAYVLHVLRNRGGFTVTHAADRQEALRQATAARWDLVLTDVEMPGMTGIELLGQLRERAPQLPVAVFTAHPSVDYAVQALRNSADEFLEKPIQPDRLVAVVAAGRPGAGPPGRPPGRACWPSARTRTTWRSGRPAPCSRTAGWATRCRS